MQVSLFNGFADKNPKPITIREVVEIIRADQRLQVLTENHRRYRAAGDTARADAEKQHMPCYSVAVLFSGGKQQNHIVAYTGLSIVDLDHIPKENIPSVLEKVRGDEHTLLAYTTISGEGVRILARYEAPLLSPQPKVDARRGQSQGGKIPTAMTGPLPHGGGWEGAAFYKQAFLTINEYYKRLTGCDYDEKCKNATRISGMAHDPDVYYNPEAVPIVVDTTKKPVGRPRKRVEGLGVRGESVRSLTPRLIRQVLAKVEAQGIHYEAGTYNKYVCSACYEMNRYGVPEEECREWAVNKFDDYDTPAVEAIVHSCYSLTDEHGTAQNNIVGDIEEFLQSRGEYRRNVITGFPEVRYFNDNDKINDNVNDDDNDNENMLCDAQDDKPDGKVNVIVNVNVQEGWQQFTDDDRNSLWRELSKRLRRKVLRQDISAVVKSDFSPKYNAFEEYIGNLQPWDGETDHIGRLASSVTVKDDQEYFVRCFKKWLVAFIAAIFDPEEVNHEILVFIGRQGSYKSTWFHYLLPPELRQYFLPKLMSNSGITKDDLFKIAQSGLVCLEEIDNMKQRDLNQLKAITTMRTINERRSYGEFNEFHRHIASFCATGNNRFFLTDHTGNRRFLTFEVESIVPPQTYDYGYEGVYAQAYALWKQGFRYWFNEEENAEINLHNTEFEAPNKEMELIQKYYRAPMPGEECKFLTATDILERINGSIKEQLSTVRIGIALRTMGVERVRSGNARGYRLVEISPDQININQKALASFTDVNADADELQNQ